MQKKPNLLTLFLLASFPTVGAVLFTPALAQLLEEFSITTSLAQGTVSVYLAGYALGQLPYGWLSNRLGRKKTLHIGLAVFAIGALFCATTHTFQLLLIGRAVMALGGAVGLMMTFAIISDCYPVDEARRVLAYLVLSAAFAPGLANLIGGMLTSFLGWHSCFYFLTGYAVVASILVARLPLTHEAKSGQVSNLHAYLNVLKQGRFILLALLGALTTTVIYIFASTAPLITIYVLDASPYMYGLVSVIPFIGSVVGCILSAKLSQIVPAHRVISWGITICISASLVKWGLIQSVGLHIWSLFIPMPFIYLGIPLIYSNSIALALGSIENKPVASAIFCACTVGLAFLGVVVMSWFGLDSLRQTALAFVILCGLMWLVFMFSNRLERRSLMRQAESGS
ncbi:MAG: multidrug effflux MFS transporter [Chlamydiales bacterium]|nr:multidrug effflux MFS transporter [Chlamydiales bacterium]